MYDCSNSKSFSPLQNFNDVISLKPAFAYRFILLILLVLACKPNDDKIDYNKSLLLGEGPYKEFDEDSNLVRDGFFKNSLFNGMKYMYKDGELVMKHHFEMGEVTYYEEKDITFDKWIVKISKEEFFLDVNKDTLALGELFKAKIVLNHRVADSIIVQVQDQEKLKNVFHWPNDNSTKFEYQLVTENPGQNELKGLILIRFNSAVAAKYKNKLDTFVFKVPYYVD